MLEPQSSRTGIEGPRARGQAELAGPELLEAKLVPDRQ